MRLYKYTAFQLVCTLDRRSELDRTGLRPMDGQMMPCEPKELRSYRCLPVQDPAIATVGYLMGHLLSFSQRSGNWVGVTLEYLYQDGRKFLDALQRGQEFLQGVQEVRQHTYRRNCWLSFGLYALWVSPPNPHQPLPPQESTTWWRFFGEPTRQSFGLGLTYLRDRKYIRYSSEGEGSQRVEIIYPNPELVAYVLFSQPSR